MTVRNTRANQLEPNNTILILGREKHVHTITAHPDDADILIISFYGGGQVQRGKHDEVKVVTHH